ncbi:hypothetical protein FD755_008368 [Muntiacus reevesi]|uniref:Cation efflux protein transmembrane domain-containing protein n=1 Tax=Muntiacus reevesi TaxID=9886 RepID=A0A5J5MK15_MUNRE|nr:hypothetical protein FD755_008368 [Muntiacus reevesi]
MGTIHLFRKPQRSFFGKLLQEFRLVAADRRSWKILLFGAINLTCTGFLLMWCSSTNSIALTAYTYLTIFDLFSLITCLISYWVMMRKPSPAYSFGDTQDIVFLSPQWPAFLCTSGLGSQTTFLHSAAMITSSKTWNLLTFLLERKGLFPSSSSENHEKELLVCPPWYRC